LATAADISVANEAACKLQCFDGVFASYIGGGGVNLKGQAKVELLIRQFGERGFDYIGDDTVDLIIWKHCRKSILVGGNKKLLRKMRDAGLDYTVLNSSGVPAKTYFDALRAHQWVKNVLVGVAAFLAHMVSSDVLLLVILAFISFSACASTVYVLNDLLDLPADRLHPTKKHRPFAAGVLPLHQAPALLAGGIFLTIAPCLLLPANFASAVGVYLALNIVYSFDLKRRLFLDVLLLSALYVLRIAAGSVAVGIPQSNWLLSFSMFIFTCLVLIKRSTELSIHASGTGTGSPRRAYLVKDKQVLDMLAVGSGMVSIAILSLYVDSMKALSLYSRPWLLWLIIPVLLYWIGRLLILAHRGQMMDDPVHFAVNDRNSIICALICIIFIYVAI
jgi:4-hydroxybenzoate polyprenyltransferase